MNDSLLEQLQKRPLLCDGAMGSLLYARGIPYEQCFDALNLTQPEFIQSIHREYISAGAQIIETNTFGANRTKLEAYNLDERVREINKGAVRLAREAREITGQPVFIAGAVGPSGRPLQAPDEHRLSERTRGRRTPHHRSDELLRRCSHPRRAIRCTSSSRPERFRRRCHGSQL